MAITLRTKLGFISLLLSVILLAAFQNCSGYKSNSAQSVAASNSTPAPYLAINSCDNTDCYSGTLLRTSASDLPASGTFTPAWDTAIIMSTDATTPNLYFYVMYYLTPTQPTCAYNGLQIACSAASGPASSYYMTATISVSLPAVSGTEVDTLTIDYGPINGSFKVVRVTNFNYVLWLHHGGYTGSYLEQSGDYTVQNGPQFFAGNFSPTNIWLAPESTAAITGNFCVTSADCVLVAENGSQLFASGNFQPQIYVAPNAVFFADGNYLQGSINVAPEAIVFSENADIIEPFNVVSSASFQTGACPFSASGCPADLVSEP